MPLSHAKIRWGYLVAFLLLMTSYVLIFYTFREVKRESNTVSHTYTVLNTLENLRSNISDVETGIRGYYITHDPRFLKPYSISSRNIPTLYQELHKLVSDNPVQVGRLDTLQKLVDGKLAQTKANIGVFQSNDFFITEEMKAQRDAGLIVMDSIRTYIDRMKEEEQRLVKGRNRELSRFFTTVRITTIGSLLIALITVFYSIVIYNNQRRGRKKAEARILQYSHDLETNIAELKSVNTELQELKSIEKFAATGRIARTIAHEVRNPLTNISLASEQLQELAKNNSDSSVLLDMIGRNATRINQLVSDLLNATRFAQLEFQETDINSLIEETLELAKDRIELNAVKVETAYSKELPHLLVDPEKMKLALLNIIVNAIEAMEKNKGVLQVRTRKQADKCIIEIRDNGVGMDEDTLQKLFEPYFTAKHKGNGLGLTNTQNIILNHGGNLKVYSKPGEGSTFAITLDPHNAKTKMEE